MDRIFINANIYTQDGQQPRARALGITGRRITAVGSNSQIRSLTRPATQVVDLAGATVLPGFVEGHIHLYDWALNRDGLDLAQAASLTELKGKLAQARPLRRGGWIIGQRFNESRWPEERLPSRADLDRVQAEIPVILWRADLHLAVANSRALSMAGITEHTPDPEMGWIDRDSQGRPTGILQDRAIDLVKKQIPPPDDAQVRRGLAAGIDHLHRLGITALHDFRLMDGTEGPQCLRVLQQLRARGQLTMRCWVCLPDYLLDEALRLGLSSGLGDAFLKIGHLKLFADGSLGARTAWLRQPYPQGGHGLTIMAPAELAEVIPRAARGGLAVAVHTIGDQAVQAVVAMLTELHARGDLEAGPVPHRMEHLQLMGGDDIRRLARLPLMGSVQPRHITDDIELSAKMLGHRQHVAYRFREMLDAGIPLVFGSDCPVSDPDPLIGIQAAVTRRRQDGTPRNGWYPEQCVTPAQAVRAFTAAGARVTGQSRQVGTLSPGKWADMVVLDKDIHQCAPDRLSRARVLQTWVGGEPGLSPGLKVHDGDHFSFRRLKIPGRADN